MNMEFGLRSCHWVIRNSQWKIMAQRSTLYLFSFIYILCNNFFPHSAIANPQSGVSQSQIRNPQLNPEQLFQAGIYAEEVSGDLQEALKLYQKIVKDFPDQRTVAAKAQLHLGLCYEKLGQPKAYDAYQKILENYPDQHEIAVIAKERLAQLKKPAFRNPQSAMKVHPLTKYYFERFGIDITTSTSYDGKYLAYTDWTTGSLMIKNLRGDDFGFRNADFGASFPKPNLRNPQSAIRNQKSETKIVAADLSRSPEYAYYPAWSRDGKYIAYSWYRGPYFVELRVVSVGDGQSWVVYSDPQLIINPHDWSPDGKTIVCETLNFARDPFKWLALARVDSQALLEILPLDPHSRGMKFSPEGQHISYDFHAIGTSYRSIYVLTLENSQATNISFEVPGNISGVDAPAWSPDGKLMLCRSLNQFDLWAVPIHHAKPAGRAFLVQSDLPKILSSMKGSGQSSYHSINRPANKSIISSRAKNTGQFFVEEFLTPLLDSAWSVFEWKSPNVYDYPSFGRYSLTDHAGYLRYYLDSGMQAGYLFNYLPQFTGWYWLYPSLEISRPLAGDHWVLEAKVTYSLIDGANGRIFDFIVYFDPERDRQTALHVSRHKNISPESNKLQYWLHDRGVLIHENIEFRSPKDTLGVSQFTYIYRITRADTLIQVELSDDDGKNFQQVFSAALRPELRGLPQLLALTGESWFVPAGAYADWDYIRFRNADF
jgi:Tol biopolymer transport system component